MIAKDDPIPDELQPFKHDLVFALLISNLQYWWMGPKDGDKMGLSYRN